MGETKFKLVVLDEAQEDTKDLRRYIRKKFMYSDVEADVREGGCHLWEY
jgi:hypothetical protein